MHCAAHSTTPELLCALHTAMRPHAAALAVGVDSNCPGGQEAALQVRRTGSGKASSEERLRGHRS